MNLLSRTAITSFELNNFVSSVNMLINSNNYNFKTIQNALISANLKSECISDTLISPSVNSTSILLKPTQAVSILNCSCYCLPLAPVSCDLTPQTLASSVILDKLINTAGISNATITSVALADFVEYTLKDTDLTGSAENSQINQKSISFSDLQNFGTKTFQLNIPILDNGNIVLTPYNNNCTFFPASIPVDIDGSGGKDAPIGIRRITLSAARTELSAATFTKIARGISQPQIVKAQNYTTVINNNTYPCICFESISIPSVSTIAIDVPIKNNFWSESSIPVRLDNLTRSIQLTDIPNRMSVGTTLSCPDFKEVNYFIDEFDDPTSSYLPLIMSLDMKNGVIKLTNTVSNVNNSFTCNSIKHNSDIIYETYINYYTNFGTEAILKASPEYFTVSESGNELYYSIESTDLFRTVDLSAPDPNDKYNIVVNMDIINAHAVSCLDDLNFKIKTDSEKGLFIEEDTANTLDTAVQTLPIFTVTKNGEDVDPKNVYLQTVQAINVDSCLDRGLSYGAAFWVDSSDNLGHFADTVHGHHLHGWWSTNIQSTNIISTSSSMFASHKINSYNIPINDWSTYESQNTVTLDFSLVESCTYTTSSTNGDAVDWIPITDVPSSNYSFELNIEQYDSIYATAANSSLVITVYLPKPPCGLSSTFSDSKYNCSMCTNYITLENNHSSFTIDSSYDEGGDDSTYYMVNSRLQVNLKDCSVSVQGAIYTFATAIEINYPRSNTNGSSQVRYDQSSDGGIPSAISAPEGMDFAENHSKIYKIYFK